MYQIGDYILRNPEPSDLEYLYKQKNDPEISVLLGGFSTGYSMDDMKDWLQSHRKRSDEIIWSIIKKDNNICVGHVGLYEIDYRVRSAEFAIMIGDNSVWGKGLGKLCTGFAVKYAFNELNMNRVHLTVLLTNPRAIELYKSLGFVVEGTMREAQYKRGKYIDILMMSLLRSEYNSNDPTG
jgi:RimJ/RimL family protein N-acetyltransferase